MTNLNLRKKNSAKTNQGQQSELNKTEHRVPDGPEKSTALWFNVA